MGPARMNSPFGLKRPSPPRQTANAHARQCPSNHILIIRANHHAAPLQSSTAGTVATGRQPRAPASALSSRERIAAAEIFSSHKPASRRAPPPLVRRCSTQCASPALGDDHRLEPPRVSSPVYPRSDTM
jgi:hypothetical protein